jgi:hypothetical protein
VNPPDAPRTPPAPEPDRRPTPADDTKRVRPPGDSRRAQLVTREGEQVKTVEGEVLDPRWDVVWDVVVAPTQVERPDPANRPIIAERPLGRLDALYHLPPAHPRIGLVITTPRSGPTPVGPNGRPARAAEIFWSGGTLHSVDLGLHHTTVTFELPSSDELVPFTATAEIEWRVEEPATVVKDNIRDVREALTAALRHRLRGVTRDHATVALTAAEDSVGAVLQLWDPGRRYGLRTSIVVRLAADEQSVAHAAKRLRLDQQADIEQREHDLKCLIERHDQERRRVRLDVYRAIIEGGNVEQFALQLASNPEDVRTVMGLFREERDEERRQLTDFLNRLLSSGAIDRWDVEDQVRDALVWLGESTQRAVQSGEYGQRWAHRGNGNGHHGGPRNSSAN